MIHITLLSGIIKVYTTNIEFLMHAVYMYAITVQSQSNRADTSTTRYTRSDQSRSLTYNHDNHDM